MTERRISLKSLSETALRALEAEAYRDWWWARENRRGSSEKERKRENDSMDTLASIQSELADRRLEPRYKAAEYPDLGAFDPWNR